jgi:replication factor A1
MKVSELKNKTPVEEITLKITAKEEPRDVSGGSFRACSFIGEDETGQVAVTLWNEDIDKVKEGDTIKITKGWAKIFNNNLQVSTGRLGKLEVL